jgi:hypothetical protein
VIRARRAEVSGWLWADLPRHREPAHGQDDQGTRSGGPVGHADPSITLRVYAHVIRRHAVGIADVFAAAADHEDEDEDEDDEDDGPDPSALVPC